jgi:hypothetical protein
VGQLQVVVNHAINQDWLDKHREKVAQGYRVHRFEKGKYSGRPPLRYVMEYETGIALPRASTSRSRRAGCCLTTDPSRGSGTATSTRGPT